MLIGRSFQPPTLKTILPCSAALGASPLLTLRMGPQPSYQWGAAGRAPQAEPSVSSSRTSSHWK